MSSFGNDKLDRNKGKAAISKPKIINLSSYDLTNSELSLLSRGFKFCPTPPKPDILQLEVDLKETIRKIELKCYFGNFQNKSNFDEPLVQKKSDFIPLESKDPVLNNIIQQLKIFSKNLHSLPKNYIKDNISKEEREAIYTLKNNSDIILTSVDKGSAIIILNKYDYIKKINEILSDESKYKLEEKNLNNKHLKFLKEFTDDFSSCFDKNGKELDYILNFNSKVANFYALPKLHKSTTLINEIENCKDIYLKTSLPSDLPFRCITAGIDSQFSKLSHFLDCLLKPLCSKVSSYIKDYIDFLCKRPTHLQDNTDDYILVTCDIKNMYNNLPIDLVIESIEYWVNMFPELLNTRFNISFILAALRLVLSNSSFKFNGSIFSSTAGIATGEPVAATVATLTIGFLEVKLYKNIHLAYGETVANYFQAQWKRFLDDCFILWKKSLADFDAIFQMLNNLHPMITFTMESNEEGLSFLNLFIYKENNFIKTDIYYKPTDSHDYLPFNSCHPRHTKFNVPGNLARMICSIVEDPDKKTSRLSELKGWLLKCGYPSNLITHSFNKYIDENYADLRFKDFSESSDDILAFVTTNNPKNPDVFSNIQNVFKFLQTCPAYEKIFQNCRLIKSQRQLPNLGRLLEKHDLSIDGKLKGIYRCNNNPCQTCNFIEVTDQLNFQGDDGIGQTFYINKHFDCSAKNIIYKLTCNRCNMFYIGKTTDLKNRVSKHKSDAKLAPQRIIDNKYVMKVSKHLSECASALKYPFKIAPFFEVRDATLTSLLTIEDYFVRKYRPILNG